MVMGSLNQETEVAVIGAGPGGYVAALRLADLGREVVLVEERDRKVREVAEKKALETIEELNARHLKVLKAIQAKALEALRSLPMNSAMDAVRALDLAMKQERLIRGEPTDRTSVDVEALIKREYKQWIGGGDGDEHQVQSAPQ